MSLQSFLNEMEERNEVLHIKDRVSNRFEVSALIKAFNNNGPVLYFENVKGHTSKIVANVCGTRNRICKAINVEREQLNRKLINAWQSPVKPKIVKEAPVKEVNERPRLSKIPILTHFEKDAGGYITSGIVYAKSPDGEIENVSIHRLMVIDDNHLAIRLVPRHLFKLWEMSKEEKIDLEIAVSIGLHPAVLLAAASPAPFGTCEFDIANALLENKMRLTECEKVNAYCPADSEIILEGVISTEREILEGPFVDVTGTYDIQRKQPVIEIVNVMHRENYIYQALLPSGMEHRLLMGLPREVMIWDTTRKVSPVVKAVNLSIGGCGWLHAIISIDKQSEGDGKNILMAAFTAHSSLKHAIVVDSEIDVDNPIDVEWALATRFQGDKDLIIIKNARGSSLDPSGEQHSGLTTKVGFDATRPLEKPPEKFERAKIPTNKQINRIIEDLDQKTIL
jgi:UbiD family decarboxylase